jgi:uncharacterized protein
MKIILTVLLMVLYNLEVRAQQVTDSATNVQSSIYYKLGLQFKDGNGVNIDYKQAVAYFTKATELGDAQSIYALAYMHYKGLGCNQDYALASKLFATGAFMGKDNSMYFYGLCWRNGYGVIKDEDSAKYWLQKSADLGYAQALKELRMAAGENSNDSAKRLLTSINNAAIPKNRVLNQYQKIENHLPAAEIIAGYYKGYIIQYDWSGKNAVSSKKLSLNLSGNRNNVEGWWKEEGIDSFKLKAVLKTDSVTFSKTTYKRTDHYSPDTAVTYTFQNAKLNLVQKGDTVFLAGTIEMFSPERKEPSKPLFVVLARIDPSINDKKAMTGLTVTPNPFGATLNVEFTLPESTGVEVQLLTMDGTIVYRNNAGTLEKGHYVLLLHPAGIAAGTYIVKIYYGSRSTNIKVIKNGW